MFVNGKPSVFGVPIYADALTDVVKRKEIDTRFKHNLVLVDVEKKEATSTVSPEDSGKGDAARPRRPKGGEAPRRRWPGARGR